MGMFTPVSYAAGHWQRVHGGKKKISVKNCTNCWFWCGYTCGAKSAINPHLLLIFFHMGGLNARNYEDITSLKENWKDQCWHCQNKPIVKKKKFYWSLIGLCGSFLQFKAHTVLGKNPVPEWDSSLWGILNNEFGEWQLPKILHLALY